MNSKLAEEILHSRRWKELQKNLQELFPDDSIEVSLMPRKDWISVLIAGVPEGYKRYYRYFKDNQARLEKSFKAAERMVYAYIPLLGLVGHNTSIHGNGRGISVKVSEPRVR